MNWTKKLLTWVVIIGLALVCALNYQLFVFPNRFAPAGLNGICTMIQHLSGISVPSQTYLVFLLSYFNREWFLYEEYCCLQFKKKRKIIA